jgi:hypothetical protein
MGIAVGFDGSGPLPSAAQVTADCVGNNYYAIRNYVQARLLGLWMEIQP